MQRTVVCFGDSNTHGYCANTDGRFDTAHRWTCLLQKKLGESFLIIEEGLSGRTTCFQDPIHEGLSGMDYIYPCLMSHEPVDLLVTMLGTNDTKERFGSSAACIALGLKRLLAKAAATDCWRDGRANILVVAPQNIHRDYIHTEVAKTMGNGCAEKSEGLPEEFQKIAEAMGCHYLDANQVIAAEPNHIDYMHLTAEGHRELAEALEIKIRGIFPEG